MDADPLIAHETQPTQTVAEMVRADERLKKEFPLVTLRGSQLFFNTAGSKDIAARLAKT